MSNTEETSVGNGASPVSAKERVELLDILRGIAILGMWTVAMTVDAPWGDEVRESQLSPLDLSGLVFIDLFTAGKFFTIFSFLFGVGFFIQIERVRSRQGHHVAYYIRRASGLLLISVVATACNVVVWILLDYAIFGLALLLFYNRSMKTILGAAALCFAVSVVFGSVIPDYRESLERTESGAATVPEIAAPEAAAPENPPESVLGPSGSHVEAIYRRSLRVLSWTWREFSHWHHYLDNIDILAMLLVGLYVGRLGAVWDSVTRRTIARKAFPWLISIGFAAGLVRVAMEDLGVGGELSPTADLVFATAAWPLWMYVLGLGYVAAVTMLMERKGWRRRLAVFAPVGRTALTNYLFTGLVSSAIIYGWQLGSYGPVMPARGLFIVFTIYPIQVVASTWWIGRFRFGPIERIWRFLTYGKLKEPGSTG